MRAVVPPNGPEPSSAWYASGDGIPVHSDTDAIAPFGDVPSVIVSVALGFWPTMPAQISEFTIAGADVTHSVHRSTPHPWRRESTLELLSWQTTNRLPGNGVDGSCTCNVDAFHSWLLACCRRVGGPVGAGAARNAAMAVAWSCTDWNENENEAEPALSTTR